MISANLIVLGLCFNLLFVYHVNADEAQKTKKLAYLVSDMKIPFWEIMSRGIQDSAADLGYSIEIYSAANSRKTELKNTLKVIKNKVDGIIVSPTSSSACSTILKFSNKANIPVVISDIGTDGGDYVSYISSNNFQGAYEIGKVLANKIESLDWKNSEVGIVAIPQKRLNGQARTTGFMKAMNEAGIKGSDLKQQKTWTEDETYQYSLNMINEHPKLRAIWLQGSNRYQGALRAIEETNNKEKVLLITFDAEPEFLDLIPQGVLVGSAMQQPYLMGKKAVQTLVQHLQGKKVQQQIQLPILAISSENIQQKLPVIRLNVLGIKD
ncbi:MAG: substrate-binding domain-containing protein [Gammaproteobacteria bacterium]|nr:substrate-binding domain-containing protein [Gammaproteobacteria bacterium]